MQILLIPNSSIWLLGATGFGISEFVGLLIAVGLIVLVWKFRFKAVEASCASCGYPVRGLKSDRCPECGGLFSEVGISPARTRRGIGTVFRCILWSIAIGIIGSQIITVLMIYGPSTSTSITDGDLSMPVSKAYNRIEFNFHEFTDISGNVEKKTTIQLIINKTSASKIAIINLDEVTIRFEEDFESPTKVSLTIESLLDWMQTSLPNTPREALRNEAAELLSTLSSVARTGGLSLFSGAGFIAGAVGEDKVPGWPYLEAVKWAMWLIWFVGIFILIRQGIKNKNISWFGGFKELGLAAKKYLRMIKKFISAIS